MGLLASLPSMIFCQWLVAQMINSIQALRRNAIEAVPAMGSSPQYLED